MTPETYPLDDPHDIVGGLEAESAALRARLAEADNAMSQALSDLEWAERTLPGTNFQASILLLRHALTQTKGTP